MITLQMSIFIRYESLRYITALVFLCFSCSAIGEDLKYITPDYITPVTTPYEQYNDINPSWSLDGKTISYERFNAVSHEIVLVDLDGERLKFVSANKNSDDDIALLLPEVEQAHYFSFDLSWSPDNKHYVFISNGSSDNFDLYLGNTANTDITRITHNEAIDNQAHWSPTDNKLVFVSSRNGRANLHLYDLANKKIITLLSLPHDAINPVWSPDGKKMVFMGGEGNAFQIYVIDDMQNPQDSIRPVTNLPYNNNIRPSWSPNSEKIAFFTLNSRETVEQQWDIVVVDSKTKTPLSDTELPQHTVSRHVIQNSLNGPSWLPDNKHIAYVQYIDDHYNPIHLVNISTKHQGLVITNTKMNRDISCSSTGILAFQSQDERWSRIFIAKLPGFKG